MSLSDFMPYGAPELLEGASPRMARATFAASGFVAAMVCCAGIIVSLTRGPVLPTIEVPPPVFKLNDFVLLPPPPSDAQPTPKINVAKGDFHVVPYEPPVLPPIDPTVPELPTAPPGTGVADGPQHVDVCLCSPAQDPPVGSYVYTDELPQLVRSVKPTYPDLPREAGVEGTVKLWLLVGLDGHVLRAEVQPKGSVPMLDQAAIDAALQFRFTPALANKQPVKVWVAQDFKFSLH